MVQGCRQLAETQELFFITITCRGKEISHEYAEKHYGEWTNRLLDAMRLKSKRAGCQWHYVQVTERQRRLHPHSHFIISFCPTITEIKTVRKTVQSEGGQPKLVISKSLRSNWFAGQIYKSGLGEQYQITKVENPEGASRYVAKYLFKPSIFEDSWPKGWKRIRYSQGFPKQEEMESGAIVLLTREDWVKLSYYAVVVSCPDLDVYETVTTKMTGSDCIIKLQTRVQ